MSVKWWAELFLLLQLVFMPAGNIILLFLENKSYFLKQEIDLAILEK